MLTLLRMQVPCTRPHLGVLPPSTAHGEPMPPYPSCTHRNLEEAGPTPSSCLPCGFPLPWVGSSWLPLPTSCGAPILRVADLLGQPSLPLLEQRAR